MIEKLILTTVGMLFALVCLLFVDVAWHHYEMEHAKEQEIQSKKGWEPPVIPSCDQELWDRIKDRCGDQLDEGED